jgi:hypothetical protein
MPDEDTFEAALDDLMAAVWPLPGQISGDPEPPARLAAMRLVYADWLEERGDPRAGAQRWMAAKGKFPRYAGSTWDWWAFGDHPDSKPEDLPGDIWRRLPGAPLKSSPNCKEYDTRRDAEYALYKSLMLLDLLR